MCVAAMALQLYAACWLVSIYLQVQFCYEATQLQTPAACQGVLTSLPWALVPAPMTRPEPE
jgi:hypothetical protein